MEQIKISITKAFKKEKKGFFNVGYYVNIQDNEQSFKFYISLN